MYTRNSDTIIYVFLQSHHFSYRPCATESHDTIMVAFRMFLCIIDDTDQHDLFLFHAIPSPSLLRNTFYIMDQSY